MNGLLTRQDSGIKFGEQPESPSQTKTEIRKVADTDSTPQELEAQKPPRSELMTLTDNFIQLLGLKPETKDTFYKVFVCGQECGHIYEAYNQTNHDACMHDKIEENRIPAQVQLPCKHLQSLVCQRTEADCVEV